MLPASYSRERRGGDRWNQRRNQDLPRSQPPPLGDLLAEVYPSDLQASSEQEDHSFRITNSQYLTSYTWLEDSKGTSQQENYHTIIVPGEPPAWTPPTNNTPTLRQDSGLYYRDQNAWRSPDYPLEPAIQAILNDKPDFPMKDINIVACGHSLSHLLGFVCGVEKQFRILVETVGDTVFLIRRENSPTEVIKGIRGYGHTFPEAYTSWSRAVKGSQAHQRILHYQFAGLDFVVRFGSDGYLPELCPDDVIPESREPTEDTSSEETVSVESLVSSIAQNQISSEQPTNTEAKKSLRLEKRGRRVPQCAVFDLKTRTGRNKDVDMLEEMLPRLWVNQIPNFILAYHESGKFDDIRIMDVGDEFREWEELNQPSLSKFGHLLKKIISFAQSSELGRFEICHARGRNALELREQTGDVYRALSPAVAKKWSGEDEDVSSH